MFEQAVRNMLTELWHLDEEEKAAFLDRPVMASDMAVIYTTYSITDSPVSKSKE